MLVFEGLSVWCGCSGVMPVGCETVPIYDALLDDVDALYDDSESVLVNV